MKLPPGVQAIHAELASREFADLDDVQAFLERRMAEYNAAPQSELGGLSPAEMFELFGGDWETQGPLRLNEALGAEAFAQAPFVVAARRLLATAAVPKGVPATASAGNLTRKTVADLMDGAPWPPEVLTDARRYNKVINEHDFAPVHVLRIVLELAGLLRRRGKAFRATPAARDLLADERTGTLAARVFRTFYRNFNLAYQGGMDETEPRQPLVPFFLLRLAVLDAVWRPLYELAPLLHPELTLADELAALDERWGRFMRPDERDEEFERMQLPFAFGDLDFRVLRPLAWFGLLEVRERPSEMPIVPYCDFRKTALFDQFVTFPPALLTATRRRLG